MVCTHVRVARELTSRPIIAQQVEVLDFVLKLMQLEQLGAFFILHKALFVLKQRGGGLSVWVSVSYVCMHTCVFPACAV